MKQIATHCNFCKKPITLSIDDSYDEIGDPIKLLPLAACNRCADLRVEKRQLESKIGFTCKMRQFGSKNPSCEKDQQTRTILEGQTKSYANLISRFHDMDGMCWDDGIVEQLMHRPDSWGDVIGRMWTMFKEWQANQSQQELQV